MQVDFAGTLPFGLTAKDMVLAAIGELGVAGGQGHVIEYTGAPLRARHRHATAAFVKFSGTDGLVEDPGEAGRLLAELADVVSTETHERAVTWLESDIDVDGGKLYLVAGAPVTGGDDEERMLRTVRRGVAVAAHDRHPRLRESELRPDHVHDPLPAAARGEEAHAELVAVRTQRVELRSRERVGDRPRRGRDVVVHRRDRQLGPAEAAPGEPERLERLRARHLVDEMQVDPEERRPVAAVRDEVRVPDLPEQGPLHRVRSAA
jgi:hypothetical protein